MAPKRVAKSRKVPALPPPLNLMSNAFTVTLRSEQEVNPTAASVYRVAFGTQYILGRWSGFSGGFKQVRLNWAHVWYIPEYGTESSGLYAAALFDKGESSENLDFKLVSSSPGSTVKKIFQVAALGWYPTEPDDKDFRQLDNSYEFMGLNIAAQGAGKIKGALVIDVNVTFRGLNA